MKKLLSILLAIILLSGTVSGLGLTAAADQTISTYFALGYFTVLSGGYDTTVLECSDNAFQVNVRLYNQDNTLLAADEELMSVSILELPSAQPYYFGPTGQSMKYSYTANFYNPKVAGDYTLRFSFAGKQLYEPCYIDIPFSVVEEKETPTLTILNNKISAEADDRVHGILTDGAGAPVSGTEIEITQYAGSLACVGSTTTGEDGSFSIALYDNIVYDINSGATSVFIDLSTKATDTYKSVSVSKTLTVANRLTAIWLDGDGSELDKKYYYSGDSVPTTDKTPTKYSGYADGYVFEKWDNGTVNGNATTFAPIGKKTLKMDPIVQSWTYGDDSSMCLRIRPLTNPENVLITRYYKEANAADETYTTTKPTDAGSYTVKFVRPETDNYLGDTAVCNFNIYQADTPEADYTVPTGLTATYGDTLADVDLPDGWEWDDALTTRVGNAGTNSFSATFTPADSGNFKSVTKTLSINVAQKIIIVAADDKFSLLSEPLAELTYTTDAEPVPGDDLGITLQTTADTNQLGHYEIHVSVPHSQNYIFKAFSGTYTVGTCVYTLDSTSQTLTWEKGGSDLKFRITSNEFDETAFDRFKGLKLDGEEIPKTCYTAERGSVKIELFADYLQEVSKGMHTLTAVFSDSSAVINLYISASGQYSSTPTPPPMPEPAQVGGAPASAQTGTGSAGESIAVSGARAANGSKKSPNTGSNSATAAAALACIGLAAAVVLGKKKEA